MDTFAGFLSVPPTSPGIIEVHTVRTETGKVFDDWVWFDEGDAVNVIVNGNDSPVVAAPSRGGADGKWIVFNQTK